MSGVSIIGMCNDLQVPSFASELVLLRASLLYAGMLSQVGLYLFLPWRIEERLRKGKRPNAALQLQHGLCVGLL